MPAARPIPALITTAATNAMTAFPGPTGLVTARTAIAKSTSPVPSLRRLSPSTIVESERDTARRLKVATTAAGSVAETIAPTMNARSSREEGDEELDRLQRDGTGHRTMVAGP
jgi:hypothetical protein